MFRLLYSLLFVFVVCLSKNGFADIQCEDNKCWRNLHLGDYSVRAYDKRTTDPSMCILDADDKVWYINFAKVNIPNSLHALYNGEVYSSTDAQYEIVDGKLLWAHPEVYLKSSGSQYINTGIAPSDTLGIKFDYHRESGTVDQVLIGSQLNNGSSTPEYARFSLGSSYSPYWGWNSYYYAYLKNFIRYTVELNYMNNRRVTYNGIEHRKNLEEHLENPYPIYVFCTNHRGTVMFCSNIKVYSVIITSGSDVVMHLVPVPAGLQIGDYTVPSNGMFDIVSQKFYGNSGKGEFEFGTDY